MTDEELHEYWKTVEEKEKKKHRKLKRFLIVLATIIITLSALWGYLMSWMYISAEDAQLYITVKDGIVSPCFKNFPLERFDIGLSVIEFQNGLTIDRKDIVYDFENDIHYFPMKFRYSVRRIVYLMNYRGFYCDEDYTYTVDGDRRHHWAEARMFDENGVIHILPERISELYYENPDGELIFLYKFDLYGDKDTTQNTDIGE